MNILLIEDDITLNDTIAEYLKFKGDDIESLEDGDKAIEIIDSKVFDLYIIDINIPNINGLDLLKYIRQKDTLTPIIMITASMELENFKIAYQYIRNCSLLDVSQIATAFDVTENAVRNHFILYHS